MAVDSTWIQKYWAQILFILGIGAAGLKNHVDTRQMKKALYDSNGQLRFVSLDQCEKHISHCNHNRADQHSETRREMQNIHDAIKDLNKQLSDMRSEMPKEIIKTLGDIKALKD